eukprot:3008601-Prymnesium_polylepis.2
MPPLELDFASYASLLQQLIANSMLYRPEIVRACLNLAMPRTCEPLSLQSEQPEVDGSENGDDDDDMDTGTKDYAGGSGSSAAAELESKAAQIVGGDGSGAADDDNEIFPSTVWFVGCSLAPQLNLRFQLDEKLTAQHGAEYGDPQSSDIVPTAGNDVEAHGERGDDSEQSTAVVRPVYAVVLPPKEEDAKGVAEAGKAKEYEGAAEGTRATVPPKRLLCFFAKFGTSSGWWLGRRCGRKQGIVAFCASEDTVPPASGWHVAPPHSKRR